MIDTRLIGYFPVKELSMGHIFEFMKRMAEGKPVFEVTDAQDEPKKEEGQPAPPSVAQQPEPLIRKNEDQTFPVVEIKRVTTHLDGDNIQIYCHFQNSWEQEVMLDKIRLLDTTHELDTFLRGGEDREFLVYKGPKLRHEYHGAELDYKTAQDGDYFRAIYDVTFTYNSMDKSYTINEMELHLPIRDIYE